MQLTDPQNNMDLKSKWQIDNELGFAQTMVAIAQLATDNTTKEILKLSGLEQKANFYLEHLTIDMTDSHLDLLPAILWSYSVLGWNPQPDFKQKA